MFDTPIAIVSMGLAIAGSVWSLAWWLNGHFSNIRRDFAALAKDIISKLEYHEKHDDERFTALNNNIWELRLRDAVLNAKKVAEGS